MDGAPLLLVACELRVLMGIRFKGGKRSGCKLTFFLPVGSGWALATVLGGPGGAGTEVAPEVVPAALIVPLAFALSRVFVRLWPGLVISPDRFLGVSAGTSRLVRGVGKNRGAGRPPTSAGRAESSVESAEKADTECCELFNDDEKNAGASVVSLGLS